MAEQVTSVRASEADILKEFEAAGMTVTVLTPEEVAVFKEAVKPVYEKWTPAIGEDLLKAFGYEG